MSESVIVAASEWGDKCMVPSTTFKTRIKIFVKK